VGEPEVQAIDELRATPARSFESILFRSGGGDLLARTAPEAFHDLNLDQVVEDIVSGRDEYELRPFFHAPLETISDVEYRHEVFRDLEIDALRTSVCAFGEEMRRVRAYLALSTKQYYALERQRWLLDACVLYCDAVGELRATLERAALRSQGFREFRAYLDAYADSEAFAASRDDARAVREALDSLTYAVRVNGAHVSVTAYEGEPDLTVEIERTFERFRQGEVERPLSRLPSSNTMSHVDERIAESVQKLFPGPFADLERFCSRHGEFVDECVLRFDREVLFYLAYLEYSERIARSGLSFSFPELVDSGDVSGEGAFDLALAAKSARGEGPAIVCNDFSLSGRERILVVTGPNQGGKTTFARMFGQLHVLASLGLPVPARAVRLQLPDAVFTHFEREEDIASLRGKLEDELVRIRTILEEATSESVLVVNEIFASTTLSDAVYLGTEIVRRIERLGCLAVVVTFVDELASLGAETVSMVASVSASDPSLRTFEIVRRPADGRAYALALADKYGLSYEHLRGRVSR
jgi:hypothetical protein